MSIADGYVVEKPLGENSADNSMDSSLVVANANGSVLERLEYLQNKLEEVNDQVPVKATFSPADVLDNVQNSLFTIAGGRVKITNIILEVSGAAVDAGASNTKLISNPTVGTDLDLCSVLDIDGDEEGTLYSITGTLTDAMTGGSGGGASGMANTIILAEGSIDILSAADSGTGGALVGATIEYIPLDEGATVVSA